MATNPYVHIARAVATKYGLDPDVFVRQIQQESGFQARVSSGAGAQGIAQIMPATARSWGVDPNNPAQALDAAARHMAGYVHSYKGDYAKALAAYNAGPGAVAKYGGVPPYAETRNYVNTILHGITPGGAAPAGMAADAGNVLPAAPAGLSVKQQAAVQMILGRSNPQVANILAARQAQIDASGASAPVVGQHVQPSSTQIAAHAVGSFDGKQVAGWIAPELEWAREHGWKGKVVSGYRSRAEQARIYNSGVRPAAKPGTSNHEMVDFPGGAIDATLADQLGQILSTGPYAGKLVWAGAKDPVHLSHPHNGSY